VSCPSCGAGAEPDALVCASCGLTLPAGDTLAQTTPPGATGGSFVITLDLRPGAVFHSRYEIQAPLGRGGMGMVFRARDRVLEETVAIKVLRPDVAQDPRMAERFRSELLLARKIRHRNVCAIYHYGEDQGLLFISMELVEGHDLKHLVRAGGGLPAEEAYDVCTQVAEGLQAVHDAGIVHRDLKTPNIMIDTAGVARLMDFGVAKRLTDGTLTSTGQVVGTPEYMSPEQAQGHRVDHRSDIYALGVVVYEVFTGQVPFRGETPISTILKHINDAPPLEGPEAAALPLGVRDVLRRALAKSPADRYGSAREMGEALRAARSPSRRQVPVDTDALRAPTVRRPEMPVPQAPLPRPAPRRRTLQPWLLAVPVVAVAGGVLLLYRAGGGGTTAVPGTTLANALPTVLPSSAPPVAPATAPVETASGGGVVVSPAPPVTLGATPHVTPHPAPTATPHRPPTATPGPTPSAATPPPATPPPTAPPPPAAAAPGQLQVVVMPWGEVTVDGRLIGQTPLDRITLPAGTHRVRVRHPAHDPWERDVVIRPGQTEKVRVDFTAGK